MKLQSLLCFLLLWIGTAITSFAQWPMTFEDNLMFTQVGLRHNGQQRQVRALIDTGCSFCVIDSTYAVDSLGIDITTCHAKNVNPDSVHVLETHLAHVVFCGIPYEKIRCCITDMKGLDLGKTFNFIIGANILKQNTWLFNLRSQTIHPFSIKDKHENFEVLRWKSHQQMRGISYDFIMLKGKVCGKKLYFEFDTGRNSEAFPSSCGIAGNDTVTTSFAMLGHPRTERLETMLRQEPIQIGKQLYVLDFYFDSTFPHGALSLEFMHQRSFALDYKHRKLYIQKESGSEIE